MNTGTSAHCLPPALLALLAFTLASHGAEKLAETRPPSSALVGDLGHREALIFEGNKTFTKEQILDGMAWHMDYHLAAHPVAPLAELPARLERKIKLGYQRAGFPEVTVKVVTNPDASKLVVRVNEGPRYRCGELRLSGVRTMTNELVRQKIIDTINGIEPGSSAQTNLNPALWSRNQPVPFDEISQAQLTAFVRTALESLDYFQPTVSIRIAPDPARRLADLRVEIEDEGIKGLIEEIEVSGLRSNTRQEVLDHLKLKPGMELHASLVSSVSNQLANSARFLHHEVSLLRRQQVGMFKLELDLEELREAPPLREEFSTEARALLKFRDWLMDWDKRPEDLVCSLSRTNAYMSLSGDTVLSSSGFALVARTVPTNGAAGLNYAFVASTKQVGFYSAWRRSKFVVQRTGGDFVLSVAVTPNSRIGEGGKHNINVMGGFGSNKGGGPFRLQVDLHPTAFVPDAGDPNTNYSLKNGVLTIRSTFDEGGWRQEVEVDAVSGRLLRGLAEFKGGTVRIRSEEGAFARVLKEIAVATADHPNEYVAKHGLPSGLSFLATDLVESPLTEPLLGLFFGDAVQEGQRTNALAKLEKVKPALAMARAVLGKQNLAGLFEPLRRLDASESDQEDEDSFFVPLDNLPGGQGANPMVALACAGTLAYSDQMLTRDSWPWVLVREAAFTLAGQGQFAEAELGKLLKSDTTGPAGCLATAVLLGKVNPKFARTFAERGLARLTALEFRKDYQILLESDSVTSQMLANALGLVRGFNDEQLTLLSASLPPAESAFLRQLGRLLREAKGQPVGAAAWPAFAEHWDKVVRRYLELGLNQFLPQVQFLTNSQALYERGLALTATNAVLQDFEEAAQCFRKAAEQGHARSQMSLGMLYERGEGVRQDLAEAMRWYQKAAEQKESHAACRLGDLYRDGKGVRADADEAARWYRPEAEANCTGAQVNLGRIYSAQNKTAEALGWFRRAAEGGEVTAQAYLGDLLSEGLFTTPDEVEACQWLTLAARAGDRMSEIRLRRVKAKLSADQLAEAQKKAEAIAERLDKKQNEASPQKP